MKITIAGRHIELNDALRNYALSKVETLERYHDGIISVDINLELEKNRNTVDIIAHLVRRKVAKVSEESNDMYASIDLAIDKLKRQLRRHKGKIKDYQKAASLAKESSDDEHGESKGLIRREVFLPKPMTPEEALVQLDSFHRNFLIFIDANSGRMKVIYRRSDGICELLEPRY
jgi:putative sigma-54 modulation protein